MNLFLKIMSCINGIGAFKSYSEIILLQNLFNILKLLILSNYLL